MEGESRDGGRDVATGKKGRKWCGVRKKINGARKDGGGGKEGNGEAVLQVRVSSSGSDCSQRLGKRSTLKATGLYE